MCLGVGLKLVEDGTIEELFLHEGAHVSVDEGLEVSVQPLARPFSGQNWVALCQSEGWKLHF